MPREGLLHFAGYDPAADGSLELVDDSDRPLESQPSPGFSFGGGC